MAVMKKSANNMNSIHKNKLRTIKNLNVRPNTETSRGKYRQNTDINHSNIIFSPSHRKIKQMGLT